MKIVDFPGPVRQRRAVIGASHPVIAVRVIPICAVRHVPRWQNSAAVLNGNADHLGVTALHLQFVGHRTNHQPMRRRAWGARDASNHFCRGIGHAGHRPPGLAVVPLVSDDAAGRGRGSAEKGGVTHCGNGGGVQIVSVSENRALVEQACQAGVVVAAKTQQVVIPELVNDDRQDQARLGSPGGRRSAPNRGAHQRTEDES